jgi:TonB family protein
MKSRLILLVLCIPLLEYAQAQRLLNDSGSLKIEQDSTCKNIYLVKILNFNGSPDEYWTMFSSGDSINVTNYNRMLALGKVFPQGKHYMFYPDSILKFEEYYDLKIRKGGFKGYYKSGAIKFKGSINDELRGKATYFYPNGSVMKAGRLVNMKPEGKVEEFYPDGKILSVTHYLYGKKDGKYISYYPDGKKKREIVYTDGHAESEKCYKQSGEKTECLPLVAGAEFPGGEEAFINEVKKIHYQPSMPTDTLSCSFIISVDTLGKTELVDFNSVEGMALYQVVKNWVKQLPDFIPATNDGIKKASQIDITFPVLNGRVLLLGGMDKPTESYWKFDCQDESIETQWVLHMPDAKRNYSLTPEFPGGESALRDFVGNNLRYPSEARNKRIQGTVLVLFYVNEKGEVINPVVKHSVDPLLDSEALRVVKLLPKFKPAVQYGKPVQSFLVLPIGFSLGSVIYMN